MTCCNNENHFPNDPLMKMNSSSSARFRNLSPSGFSLIEVTIATGIAAFGIITLLGLLPSGMNLFRDAMNVTVSSQIAQQVIKEAVQTDYNTLVGIGPGAPAPSAPVVKPRRYFTDEGVELPADEIGDAVFHVHTRVMAATDLPTAAGLISNSSLATITVQVAVNPGNAKLVVRGGNTPQSGTLDTDSAIPFVTYTSHIAKAK